MNKKSDYNALVITIIILLILAGITINLTIGQRGIIRRAEEADNIIAGIGSIARNNIYDMGGNVFEWTTEVCSNIDRPCMRHGAYYNNNASENPAGERGNGSQTDAGDFIGFRSTLYIQ